MKCKNVQVIKYRNKHWARSCLETVLDNIQQHYFVTVTYVYGPWKAGFGLAENILERRKEGRHANLILPNE